MIDHLHNQLKKEKSELTEANNNVQNQFTNKNEILLTEFDTIKNENIIYKKQIESLKEELNQFKNTKTHKENSDDEGEEEKCKIYNKQVNKESDEDSDDFFLNRKNVEKIINIE